MMAFDLDGYLKDAEVRREERQAAEEAKARQEAEDAKPWYEKLWGAASDFGDDLVDTMKERGETFADAYGRYIGAELDAIARANETGDYSGKYADTPELRESSVEALVSGVDLATTPARVAAYHATAPIRERVGAFIEEEANEGSEFAQDLRSTEAFVNYFMTPEEKLKKAREIEANTGISADSFLDDDIAYKEALKINDFTNKRKAAMQENFSMETVWQEFPELREVAKMSPRDAALALHDIESVRQTHGIVEAFTHFLAVGEKQLELDNIGAKIMMGTANENDHARAAELEKMLEEDKKKSLPSFFDDPLSAMAGGVASSAPEMLDSIREGGAWAWAGMIASGAAGTAVEPGGGTAVLGAAGGVVGFLRGVFGAAARREGGRAAIRTMFGAAARREAGRTALRDASLWGLKGGTFYGMAKPEAGRRFLEYSEMTDTDGNPLMTDAEAKNRAALGGALNAGIELWNAGMLLKPLTRFAGKAGAQGIEKAAIEGIVNRAKYDLGKRESVAVFAKDQVKDVLKIAATETAEESAQSVSDDLIHNYIVASADGRAAEAYYSFADITAHAAVAGAEAVPAALGFGLAGGSLHLPGGAIRHAHRLSSEKAQEDSAVQTTVTGTVMLGRLQQVASSAKLKETAPDVQRKLIRAQVRGTGFENVYIDAAAALEKESGLADLKAVAKAAELSDAAVENAVQHGGYLFVPIEKYAQSDASPALLEAVSFAPEADSLARIKKNAKDLSDAVEEAQKKAVKTRIDISQTITHEWFPEAPQHASEEVKARRKAEYEAAMSAITMNPTNPKQGWRLLHGGFIAERAALLQPATEVLERDVKNGSAAWVEDFKKEHGHAPTQEDMLTLAYRLMVGDAAAPKVEGWQTLTQEEMDSAKGQLDALNDRIRTMEDIESRMKEVDGSEIRMASGLSPEAYSVYRQLMASLKAIGGVQSKAARLNALLFARHADQYARVMREKKWEKDYTALDYYRDTFAVEHGERTQAGGFTQAAMQRSEAETLEEFSRRMRTPEAESGSRNKKFLRIISSSGTAVDVAQDDMLHIHHRHPEMKDADFALIQENMENFSRVHLDMTGKGDYGGKTILCKIKTPRGAAGVAYELLPTGRIFLKTAFFDNENSIDSWIIKNGTSKDLMQLETEKRGNAASMLTGHPSRTDKTADSLTPSVIQPLSLPMIQERLGIVNQANRFYQSAGAEERLAEDEAAWSKIVDDYEKGTVNATKSYTIMDTPLVLQLVGVPHLPLKIDGRKIEHILEHDGMNTMILRELPRAIADPLMVFDTYAERKVVVVDLKDANGATIIVPIDIRQERDRLDVNILNNAYGKNPRAKRGDGTWEQLKGTDFDWFIKQNIEKSRVLYMNTKKSAMWAQSEEGDSLNKGDTQDALSSFIVSNAFQNVKTENDLEAARAAHTGFYQRAWHSSPYDFSAFDLGNAGTGVGQMAHGWGVHCAADRKTSEVYRGDDGRTYEVEIPEDDVLLDEQKSYDEQPQKVRKALDKLVRGLTMEQLENWNDVRRLGKAAVTADIKEALSESDGMNIYGTISDLVDGQEEASKLLNQYGVKGIVYDDGQGGRGFVVFDDRAISIVEKFYQKKSENALAEQKEAVRRQYAGTALWMKAPNGVQTNLTEEQWLTVRTPAFKAWFGDWEQVARFTLPSHAESLEEAAAAARSMVGKRLTNDVLRIEAVLSNKNVGKMVSESATRKSVDARVHALAVANVDHLFSRAIAEYTHKDRNNDKNIRQIHRMFAPFVVGNEVFVAKLTVKELAQEKEGNRLYSVEALEIKEASRKWNAAYNATDGVLTSFPQETFDTIIANFLQDDNKDADLSTNAGHKIYSVQMLELKKSAGNLPRSAVKRSSATADLSAISIAELADKYNPLLDRVDENGEPLASSLAQNFSQEEKRTSQGEIAMQPDGKRLIRLFRTADESTFLHEMGHLFLMDLDVLAKIDDVSAKDLATVNEWAAWKEGAAKEYADTDWADEFRDHEAAILAALASGDALRIARAKDVWRHERFARGFELYLREGKAPSVGLRGVFRKFRMFLRKVYSFVQSLGGRPSLAVEAVMARMIAAEEEIQAALLDERYRPVEKLGGEETLRDLMGEDMEKLYAKWLQEAQEEAEDLLRAQVMKDLKREAREAYEEEVAKEREKKRAELEKEPVYLAEAALEKSGKAGEAILGHWYDSLEEYKEERAKRKSLETELTEYIEAYARDLDKKMLAEHLTEENIEKAMTSPKAFGRRRALEAAAMRRKERLMAYIGGEVAEAKKEVEEHLSAMKEDADETAKKKLQAALERLKGSAKWSGEEYAEIEEIARAKTQEEQQKKYEAFKAKHKERAKERVRKQAEEKRRRKDFEEEAWANERFFREQARLFLASLPISESCNPEFFRRKEKQHARAAAKAAAQRKWDKARAERENQAHAAACAYEATRMREEMQKLTADVQKKLGARTVRIQATERYWLHHLAYLLGLKKSDVEKPEGALDLAELFDSYKDNLDLDADAPTEILELLAREETSYKSMTLGQLRQTVNMLRALYTIGRDKNRVLSFAGKDFADVAQEILSSKTRLAPEGVKQHPVSPDTGGVGYSDWLAKAPGIGEQMALLAQKGMLNLMKPEVMIRLLGEEAHSYIYGTIERAQMKETKLLGESQDELLRIFSVYTKEERMTWKDRTIKAGGEKLTKENVLCLALNWGSEINRKRILDGIGQKLDVEAVLAEHMTEKDWKVVQEVWDFIDTFWKETAAVEEKLNGSRLGKVPAAPFSIRTADGAEIKLRGGYYPLKYNAEKSTQAKEHAAEEEAKRGAAGAKVLGAHRGHTKRRSEGEVKEPVLLEFDVLNSHVYDAAHNIAFRIAARDVHRILRQKDFKQYVASTYGLAFWNRLDQWALDVWAVAADGSDLAATALSRTMAAFRCNSTMAIMGYRLWPVIENATNIGPMMDKLGAAEAHAAVADYYGNKKSMDALLEKSLFMMNRINNMERDLRQDTHIFAPTYAPIEFLRDNAYWALAQTDLMLSKPLWCRAYKNAFAKALAAVNRENAENRRTYQEAQEEVERLRAEVYDLRKELFGLEEESKERRYMNPEQLKGSPYAGMSEREIEDEKKRRNEALKEKERAFYEAGHRLERAAALPIREGAELIEEAEMRSVQAADGAVRDVIGSGQTKDLSALQRSRNEAVKMFTSFYSYFNTQFNALLESHFKGKYSEEGTSRVDVWMPLARSLIYRIVLVSILGAMGKFALGLEGDDDRARYRTVKDPKTGEKKKVEVPKEERFLRVLGKNLLSTTTGTMPFFRDFAGMVASKVFDGTTYGRNFELGSVVTRGLKQAQATMELIEKKGEQDLAREENAAEERRKMQKMTPHRRRQYEENKKYKKPKKEIGYIDVMKSGAQTLSTMTAARTGVTNTLADGMFTVLQYMTDSMEKDPYYDRSMENVLRSVLFDKKLRVKETPEKPKKHKDKRRRRGAR
jgi:hypothetical protein